MQYETKQSNSIGASEADLSVITHIANTGAIRVGFEDAAARLILQLQKELDDLRTQTEAAFKHAGFTFHKTDSRRN